MKCVERVLVGIIVLVMLVTGQISWAKEEKNIGEEYDLGKIVITATRIEQYQAEVGSSLSVITAEDLKKTGKRSVVEVLRDIPGVVVSQNSPFGGQVSIYLRGSKPGHTLVLIDGVEVNDPMSPDRSFDFAYLTTDNIERIEIVRGPQSTLYGSDAMGGVINIITKKGKGKPKWEASLKGGSYNTLREHIGFSGARKKLNYSFSLSCLNSKGISKAAGGLEKDGYINTTVSSRLGYEILNKADLNLILRYTDAKTDVDDSSYDDDSNHIAWSKDFTSKLEFSQILKPWWNHKLSFSYNNIWREYKDEPDSVDTGDNTHNWYEGENKNFEWQHNFSPVGWNTITAGFEYKREEGFSDGVADGWSTRFDRKSADNAGYYLQNQLKFWRYLFITLGLRVDNHEMFGTGNTYKVSTAYIIPRTQTRLKANWGTGFKAPSLYQLYSSFGNPNLKPEESEGYDFGFEQNLFNGRVSLGLTYFHNEFKNLIDFDWLAGYVNIGRVETKGTEAEVSFKPIKDLAISANYTYLDAKDKETGLKLLRRPKEQIGLDINWQFSKKGNLNLGANYVGERMDVKYVGWVPQRLTIKSYTKVDLSAYYNLRENFQVFGRVENLFNEKYQEIYGYATPGTSFYSGVKVTFK